MSDSDIRLLERRHAAGQELDALEQARLFAALWKRGEADVWTFTVSVVFHPTCCIDFGFRFSSKPELRVPVRVSMKALVLPQAQAVGPFSSTFSSTTLQVITGSVPVSPCLDVTWSEAFGPGGRGTCHCGSTVEGHGYWDEHSAVSMGDEDYLEIEKGARRWFRGYTGETATARWYSFEDLRGKHVLFYPMVVPEAVA